MTTMGFLTSYTSLTALTAADERGVEKPREDNGFEGLKAVEDAVFVGANRDGMMDDVLFELLSDDAA